MSNIIIDVQNYGIHNIFQSKLLLSSYMLNITENEKKP